MEDFAGSSNWTGDGTVLCSGERLGVSCHISLCTPRPSKGLLQSVSLLNAHLPSIRNLMIRGFPGGSLVESACQCRRCRFNLWVEKIPWRSEWQPTPVFLKILENSISWETP